MRLNFFKKGNLRIPIATKLILSFLLIVVIMSVVFSVVGVRLIGDRIVSEAQERVRTDLNSAREIYLNRLGKISDEIRFVSERTFVRNGSVYRDRKKLTEQLAEIREKEKLDVLSITDHRGKVLLSTTNPDVYGDDLSYDEIIKEVFKKKEIVSSTEIVPGNELQKESQTLAEKAYFKFIYTPKARFRKEEEEKSGLMLKAAAPIFDFSNRFIGVVYGGVLLNRNFEIVDKIKETVFQNVIYEGVDIGTATIFLDDLRISTNVKNEDGSRAIGTRIAEDVYDKVVTEGKPWIGRAYVVNNWYITAYEPIRSISNKIIGILYVGILEQKYTDIQTRTIVIFLGITLMGAFVSMSFSYVIARKISGSINRLVTASREVAHGNLDARVEIKANDELHELADSFNSMASALKNRDQQLKDFARKKIMESERLAVVGQLAADVAHEINNPLQGIVAFSHLLLEQKESESSTKDYLKKIVNQADRCTEIIRGLLDFSRQRKPQNKLSDVHHILKECTSLIENQAIFHNIQIAEDLKQKLPSVVIDPSQIQQVFVNMIINAAEAMDGDGKLTIHTSYDPSDKYIEIEFTDTGHGISEENLDRIFDPFFTTKELGHGTGLGLAISYGIIKEHLGTISVQSEIGKGTTFTVRLPVKEER
ncbi:MAG: cache domain-containing protein [Bacteroidota bacterium]|nr:cache domain-containing protein [Bacteroidota bacterium]